MNRPYYEALDAQGLPYIRPARVAGELPTPSDRSAALEEASHELSQRFGKKLDKCIGFGTPVHLAFNMSRAQAKNHPDEALLLSKGAALSLDHCASYS